MRSTPGMSAAIFIKALTKRHLAAALLLKRRQRFRLLWVVQDVLAQQEVIAEGLAAVPIPVPVSVTLLLLLLLLLLRLLLLLAKFVDHFCYGEGCQPHRNRVLATTNRWEASIKSWSGSDVWLSRPSVDGELRGDHQLEILFTLSNFSSGQKFVRFIFGSVARARSEKDKPSFAVRIPVEKIALHELFWTERNEPKWNETKKNETKRNFWTELKWTKYWEQPLAHI